MNDTEQYVDPGLARRIREWIDETAPTAAPERLVFAVMDAVEAQPLRRRRVWLSPRFAAVPQYVALTVAVALGVAIGTRLAGWGMVGAPPSPAPTASVAPSSAAPSPVAIPSLSTTARISLTREPGPSAISVAGNSMWVGTPDGELVELDPVTGAERSRTRIGVVPITIVLSDGVLWIGSGGPDLVWLDPTSRVDGTIRGAGGHVVLEAAGSLWVSGQERILRIDAATRTVVGSIPVPAHDATDVAAIVGDELWAAAGSSILRLGLPSGSVLGTVEGQPSAIVNADAGIFAVDRGQLIRLAGAGGVEPLTSPVALLDGLPQAYGLARDGDRLWIAGPMPSGAGEVVGVDLATMRIASRTVVGGGPGALALVDGSLWVAVDSGALARLQVAP